LEDAERRTIRSVGIDVGTTTSHLVFSELVLEKDPFTKSRKFHVAERNIVYRGRILFTPLREGDGEIDTERLVPLLLAEYDRAGLSVEDVETGAVIITGESARKGNAEEIVERLARESGGFVATTAGPNFEAVISAHGSGAVDHSKRSGGTIIHCDIGGGTSNVAVIKGGEIMATVCINVGSRLIAFDEDLRITRLEQAGGKVLDVLGLDLESGDRISPVELERAAGVLAGCLLEVLTHRPLSALSRKLMMTSNLNEDCFGEDVSYSFSGGVAEYIYGREERDFGDLGLLLGRRVVGSLTGFGLTLTEPPEGIRATVIGASGYTLRVSGSTTYISPEFRLPLRNLPVIAPNVRREQLSVEHVSSQIASALARFDLAEGESVIALAFHDPVRTDYEKLRTFAIGLVEAIPRTIERGIPIILVFDTDIGNSVGNVLFRETGTRNVLSIDEINLGEGDFIDIGEPFSGSIFYPVIVKSLVFASGSIS